MIKNIAAHVGRLCLILIEISLTSLLPPLLGKILSLYLALLCRRKEGIYWEKPHPGGYGSLDYYCEYCAGND